MNKPGTKKIEIPALQKEKGLHTKRSVVILRILKLNIKCKSFFLLLEIKHKP